MSGQAWVQLALNKLSCNQKKLAATMGVSPTQVTKWKAGEYVSFEMENRFREITEIGSMFPDFVIWARSKEDAEKWQRLILEIAEIASSSAETGYVTAPLEEEPDILCWQTFYTLREMGINIPSKFPIDLEILLQGNFGDDADFDALLDNEYASLILDMFKSLNDVYGFFVAYIRELVDDERLDLLELGMEIESGLMGLAASKITVPDHMSEKFRNFCYETERQYREWIENLKNAAIRSGAPLRAELSDFVEEGHDAIGHEAEAENLGFNKNRIHPDVYMNEILIGIREIRKVIPAIAEKLDVDISVMFDA